MVGSCVVYAWSMYGNAIFSKSFLEKNGRDIIMDEIVKRSFGSLMRKGFLRIEFRKEAFTQNKRISTGTSFMKSLYKNIPAEQKKGLVGFVVKKKVIGIKVLGTAFKYIKR